MEAGDAADLIAGLSDERAEAALNGFLLLVPLP
jgi:hypothetical protein